MTEAEWLACAEPEAMLKFLGKRFSDRQIRLFSCACCRRVWRFAKDERLVTALDALERYADGGKEKVRLEARRTAKAVYGNVDKPQDCISSELRTAAEKTVRKATLGQGNLAAAAIGWSNRSKFSRKKEAERTKQTDLLRDMAGNPFRPVVVDPDWRNSTVVALARGIYDERAFERLPILADALQDAGCDNDDVLNHCRGSGPHVRGCWVVDLVLGKR